MQYATVCRAYAPHAQPVARKCMGVPRKYMEFGFFFGGLPHKYKTLPRKFTWGYCRVDLKNAVSALAQFLGNHKSENGISESHFATDCALATCLAKLATF